MPATVQALIQVSDVVNVGEGGESWPTKLVVYQLSGSTSLDQQLDPAALESEGEKVFGDEFVDKRELTAYPTARERMELSLKPNVTHLVVVAQLRETIGTAWYATMAVPAGTRDQQCAATAKGDEPPMPCLYVALERSELAGGAFPPPGFSTSEFGVSCAAIAAPKKKKAKKGPPQMPNVPQTPQVPKTPTTPELPSAPRAPTAPSAPKAPRLPG